MENNKGNKSKNILQKLYDFRVKVDRKGKPVVNVSSIFAAACLIFAPHMTIAGIVLSLILGYQIRVENEDGDGQIEEQIRKAAMNVKNGVTGAAKSIQKEFNRATAERQQEKEPAKAAEPAQTGEELLRELEEKAQEPMESNPAATTFHSAYAASASVPVLQVSDETETPDEPSAPAAKGSEGV